MNIIMYNLLVLFRIALIMAPVKRLYRPMEPCVITVHAFPTGPMTVATEIQNTQSKSRS